LACPPLPGKPPCFVGGERSVTLLATTTATAAPLLILPIKMVVYFAFFNRKENLSKPESTTLVARIEISLRIWIEHFT
jgi:hypothetical protein